MKKEELNFEYYNHENYGWVVPIEMCKLGGCDTKFIFCENEEHAYQTAVKLTEEGKEPKIGFPCPSCYREYIGW